MCNRSLKCLNLRKEIDKIRGIITDNNKKEAYLLILYKEFLRERLEDKNKENEEEKYFRAITQ